MLSKTCEYAIRAILFISQKTANGKNIGVKEIAAGIDSPEPFIAKILQELSRKNLVQSSKGPNGGFSVDAQSMNISLATVVLAIDGDQLFSGCGLGLKYCSESSPCPIHEQYKSIRNQIKNMLENTRIGEFNELLSSGVLHLKKD